MIVDFADAHAGANRSDAYTDFIRKGWRSHGTDHGGNKQRFPHVHTSRELNGEGMQGRRCFVPLKS